MRRTTLSAIFLGLLPVCSTEAAGTGPGTARSAAALFQVIRYWRDEDSGHWEECRKIEPSSIGAVIDGLRELRLLLTTGSCDAPRFAGTKVTPDFLDRLIEPGIAAGGHSALRMYPARPTQKAAL
jgi:hypothetical protein